MNNWQGQGGLSSACTLEKTLVVGLLMFGQEHPCDRCNMDRAECRGFERKPDGTPEPQDTGEPI